MNAVTTTFSAAEQYELNPVEVQRGVWQLSRALEFIHQPNVRLVHGLVAPEYVYINTKGDWKLAGFQWSIQLPAEVDRIAVPAYQGHLWRSVRQNLDYMAPEWLFINNTAVQTLEVGYQADIFSLACLWFELLDPGKESPMQSRDHLGNSKQQLGRLADLINTALFIPLGEMKGKIILIMAEFINSM
jgi:SCY1-like protein 2